MKKLLSIALTMMLAFAFAACGGETPEAETPPAEEAALSFTLTAGEAGEYGKLITYNEGTEFEESFYAYYVPEGTYTVTNEGEYMSQVTVCSDEKETTEEGWEEAASIGDVKMFDVGQADTISVASGMHIEIIEPSVFKFEQQ